jgi:hypothetical protein
MERDMKCELMIISKAESESLTRDPKKSTTVLQEDEPRNEKSRRKGTD